MPPARGTPPLGLRPITVPYTVTLTKEINSIETEDHRTEEELSSTDLEKSLDTLAEHLLFKERLTNLVGAPTQKLHLTSAEEELPRLDCIPRGT